MVLIQAFTSSLFQHAYRHDADGFKGGKCTNNRIKKAAVMRL